MVVENLQTKTNVIPQQYYIDLYSLDFSLNSLEHFHSTLVLPTLSSARPKILEAPLIENEICNSLSFKYNNLHNTITNEYCKQQN